MGEKVYKVHRVTPKKAYIKYNDVAEGVFPRIVPNLGFRPQGSTPYSSVSYKVFTQ
jgi:hypothetical protein